MTRSITDPNDPRVRSPEPTLDMLRQFGAGTQREDDDTGAAIVEREMQVEVTSPQIRADEGSTAPVEERKNLISARRTNVHVRSGNMNWKTGHSSAAAPEQTAMVGTRDFLPGMGAGVNGLHPMLLVGGAMAAVYFLFLRR